MGAGVEYIRENIPLGKGTFVRSGSGRVEDFIGRKTRISLTTSVDGNMGTIFVAGNTRNLNYHLFQNESDEVGRRVKPNLIEDNGKTGVFVEIEKEQQLLIVTKNRKVERAIFFFMCASREEFENRTT